MEELKQILYHPTLKGHKHKDPLSTLWGEVWRRPSVQRGKGEGKLTLLAITSGYEPIIRVVFGPASEEAERAGRFYLVRLENKRFRLTELDRKDVWSRYAHDTVNQRGVKCNYCRTPIAKGTKFSELCLEDERSACRWAKVAFCSWKCNSTFDWGLDVVEWTIF